MRTHICWLFFKKDAERLLIRNNENNENWPNIWKFADFLNDAEKKLEEQRKFINEIEIKNNKTRQLIADIRTWFINEYNLFGKPAKKAQLAQEAQIRKWEREIQQFEYNLAKPKTPLSLEEKQCLEGRIKVWKWKLAKGNEELEELKKETEKEKKELCLRLSYEREDLEPFLRELKPRFNPKTNKIEPVFNQYSRFWNKFKELHPSSHTEMPLAKLRSLIAKWQEHNRGREPRENPCEIWVEEKTNDSLVFLWKPIEEIIGEDKNKKEVKGVFLSMLKNYLFNYYGEWYEVSDYQQINYQTIAVVCEKSIFYNGYLRLAMCAANVILHHSPYLSQEEICSCPSSEYYSTFGLFSSEYELSLELYRLGKTQKRTVMFEKIKEEDLPILYQGVPEKTSLALEKDKFKGIFKDGFEKGLMFFYFGKSLNNGSLSRKVFIIDLGDKEQNKKLAEKGNELLDFKWVGGFNTEKKRSDLEGSITEFLKEEGLLENNMYHFLKDHVRATLYWRGVPFWRGSYWTLHNQGRLIETISNDGNCVTIKASGLFIARVKELVTIVCEGEDSAWKILVRTIITAGTTAATIAAPAMAGPATVSKTMAAAGVKAAIGGAAGKAGAAAAIGITGGLFQSAFNKLTEEVPYQDFSQTMNIHEFKHKYFTSGTKPLSLKVEFSRELANQYLNRRELKGQMLYTYKNFPHFGKALAQKDFLKASVISWNMTQDSGWWREKIESGIFLYADNHNEFYQKKLTEGKLARGRGGDFYSDWDEIVMEQKDRRVKKVLLTADMRKAEYSSEDYISSRDSALWNQMESQLVGNKHRETNSHAYRTFGNKHLCLGCLTGGGHKGDTSYHYKSTMNLTVGGTVYLKTIASREQSCLVPRPEEEL